MTRIDYSSRDKAVVHNVYASVRRRAGVSPDQFRNYWRDVHATLCSRIPGLGFYVQQHFDRDAGPNLWPVPEGTRRIDALLDGSAELGFLDAAGQAAFNDAGRILYADEHNLFGESVAYFLPRGSVTFVDHEEDGERNGADRLHRVHVYMNRRVGTDASRWLMESHAELARDDAVRKWKLHLPEPYDNAQPAPPSPDVDHLVGNDRMNVAVAEVAFENPRAAREFFSGAAFKAMLSRQGGYVDAVGAWRVTGFYTFVRDGVVTTAGLRGSRPAELIDRMGATNHLTPDVRARFVRSGAG